ncbi:hypothetical protein EI165_19000 [Pseudoalteromonas nigrifaciens]|uniref:hypothetical protein n=1 Tax=Pseudoalteromonas nigrifaciens TaxID=28109 RepID=UPI001788005F|nr:hypothetical protein [Pseudoalteromonas nigrifaciens]MBE0422152.1 hypothetical protein [Pseudoalteromonas nigrifaciens]
MNDIKALFLAIIMDKYLQFTDELVEVGNNAGINQDLVGEYLTQVKTDTRFMQLSLKSKIGLVEGSSEELANLIDSIILVAKDIKPKELQSYLG